MAQSRFIYLDHAATTPVDKRVVEAMIPYFTEKYGNPSSIYSLARETRRGLESARELVAQVLRAQPRDIVFTACGSESDNTAIKGVAEANQDRGKHIITSAIEHEAVLETCKYLERRGFRVTYLPVDESGTV